MEVKQAIDALTELEKEIDQIGDSATYLNGWKDKTVNTIGRIFGDDAEPQKQIKAITYRTGFSSRDQSSLQLNRSQAREILSGLIRDINRFGLPDKASKRQEGLHINITQNQKQDTKIDLNLFISAIQEELTGKQLKEVQEIIDEKEITPSVKKTKIIEKLKSFGGDIASNIIAGILTNPALFS